MTDLRIKDIPDESSSPGPDYYLVTDSATDGVRKVLTKNVVRPSDIGLGNVDNTADADKPVSTATQTALNAKATTADLGSAAYAATTDFATNAQGALANSALQPSDAGALPGNIVQLDSLGRLPAVNGSQLLNLPGGGDALKSNLFVTTRANLATLTGAAAPVVSVYSDGVGNGQFVFNPANLASQVAVDTRKDVYVAPSSDATGASGAWVRSALPFDNSVVFRGVSDARSGLGGIAAGNNVFLTATPFFTANDVGKSISVAGAGVGGAALVANIVSFGSDKAVTLDTNASTNVVSGLFCLGTDNSPAMNAAVAMVPSVGNIVCPNGGYFFKTSITLPQAKFIRFCGAGIWATQFVSGPDGSDLFYYQRGSGQGAAVYEFMDINFVSASQTKFANTHAIGSYGYSDAASDNYLRVYRCRFIGYYGAISAKWTGQSRVHDCSFAFNNYSILLQRGSSQWDLSNNMSFDAHFLDARDSTYDAFSNGLTLYNNLNFGAVGAAIYVEGWQSIYMTHCGMDMGSTSGAAIYFNSCIDFVVTASFISSNNSTTRVGVLINGGARGHIIHNTIVNNSIGVDIRGVNGVATRISVIDNTFDGNDACDIILRDYATCWKIKDNHHSKQMSRVGSNYEVYSTGTGVDFGVWTNNTFHGSSFALSGGANSVMKDNIFGTTAG